MHGLLAAYRAATGAEQQHLERMLALLDTPDRCSRDQFSPGHFTASGFVVPPERDALLLVWHSKIGAWLQPGGHIEPGDADPLAAARREVVEETGVSDLTLAREGLFDVDVHRFPARGDDPAHLHFDLRFLFQSGTRRLDGGTELSRWVALGEVGGDESMTRPAAKLR